MNLLSASSESQITSQAYVYDVSSGPFVTYTRSNHNCFHATAIFADATGYGNLMSIYNQYTTNYKKYSAYKMYQSYNQYWTYHGFYH